MPSLFKSVAALAMAGVVAAIPAPDACLAAVTGKAALGDDKLRQEHCSSFIKTIVTPSAVTVTTTITDAPQSSAWQPWKRDVTYCPNEVPNYASACNEAGYKSACKALGVSSETTVTIPATTTTKTVYVGKGGNGGNGGNTGVCTATSTKVFEITKTGCSGGVTTSTKTETSTATVTKEAVTVTKDGSASGSASGSATTKTITVTVGGSGPTAVPAGKCLDDSKAEEFVNAFKDLLEYTSYNGTQGPPGRGYHYNVSAKYLAEDFKDYSDSINWMAGFPLGSATFGSKAAFDYGQGLLQTELAVKTVFISHNCKEITWKWSATTATRATVLGINHFTINDDLTKMQTNHAEFNNGAWISSFGIPSQGCKTPQQQALSG